MSSNTRVFSCTLWLAGVAAVAAVAQPSSLSARQSVAAAVTVVAVAVALCVFTSRASSSSGSGRAKAKSWAFKFDVKHFFAHRGTPSAIDGNVFKPEWEKVPWSDPFVEIRGEDDAPEGTGPTPAHATRMKMMWDDEYLYVAAVLDFPAGYEIIAKFTERNTPIFHTDSDFEVFIDPAGCNHGYKELELNAINTVWNLMLNRPYGDGGSELSGRIAKLGEPNHWDVKAQTTATRVTKGALHTPGDPAQWVCEIAFAHTEALEKVPVSAPKPAIGGHWRINFSRVEEKGNVNWVWSPQVRWSAKDRRYVGQVNMHQPDSWGYVVFADSSGKIPGKSGQWQDPEWPARRVAMAVYHAIRDYQDAHKKAPASFEEVEREGLLKTAYPESAVVSLQADPAMNEGQGGWIAKVQVGGSNASVTDRRLLKVWQ